MKTTPFYLLFFFAVGAYALTLEEAIDKTLHTNPEALAASLRHESAIAEIESAKSARQPKVNLGVAYYPTKTYILPANGIFSTKQDDGFHADVSGVYTLLDFGRTENKIKAAQSAKVVAHSAQSVTNAELIEQVWQRYYGVSYADLLIDAAKSSVSFYEAQYERARGLRKNGLKTKADELRFFSLREDAKDRLSIAQSEYEKASLALATIIGEERADAIDKEALSQKSKTITAQNFTKDSLIQTFIQTNPNLKRLNAKIAQAKAGVDAARHERFGEVALVGTAAYDHSLSEYDSYQAGVAASIPLYDGGKISASTQKSRIAHAEALEEYESTKRELTLALGNAYEDLKTSEATINAKMHTIVSTTEALSLMQERYRQGLATYVELLESQNALESAKVGLAGAKYQKIIQFAKIQKLLDKETPHVSQN